MSIFKKLLIANRGEIAVRIIRACHELGITTVAIYSEVDKNTLPVKLADESLCIGPAPTSQSYLNIPAIISAAEITDAEAIHPGYGFLAENPHFAEACITSGITFVGPTPENIRLGGDKAKARQTMKRRGIPIVPGSDGPIQDEEAAIKIIKKIGVPSILKASAGGGGKGMRIVADEKNITKAFHMAQRESLAAFGNGELYVEKYIPEMRHIEVQIIADNKGGVVHLGERECSIQRRHQKLIEEAPYIFSNPRFRKKVGEIAVKAARVMKYRNAGTVEMIMDGSGNIYFMEINTRIQVEHPVTEMITGVDLIKEQIKLAAGEPLAFKQQDIKFSGHCIECRVNAEDPDKFIPYPGKISTFIMPGGPGVRVDTAAFSGWVVPAHYDSLIAKVVAHANTREEAIARMRRALREFFIEGIKTTIPFYLKVLDDPDFLNGNFNTHFLERFNTDA
jgi:acetyl-CoA carboxylase biotin carboxylase subunit